METLDESRGYKNAQLVIVCKLGIETLVLSELYCQSSTLCFANELFNQRRTKQLHQMRHKPVQTSYGDAGTLG